MAHSRNLQRQIKAELKRRGLTYREISSRTGLTEAAVRNTLSAERELLTRNAAKLLEALELELTVSLKEPRP